MMIIYLLLSANKIAAKIHFSWQKAKEIAKENRMSNLTYETISDIINEWTIVDSEQLFMAMKPELLSMYYYQFANSLFC